MKKRILSILLALCLAMSLLPAQALAAESGFLVTLDYDASLCSVTVTDRNDSNAPVANGEYLTIGSNGKASAIFEIENVAKGYRIADVTLNGVSRKSSFIMGAYGGYAWSGISSDITMKVTLEEVPEELPALKSFGVYGDEACTQLLDTDLTITEATTFYLKAEYVDGQTHEEYTVRGHMEYSLDGTDWSWTEWGGGYTYFPLNDTFYKEFDPLTDSYDLKIYIEPDGLYCTGETLVSQTYHVNGGAGCKLTFNYPADLCSMSAESEDGTVYHSGDTVPADTWLSYDITDIASGYRIKSVTWNGQDWTKNFVNGAYGSIGTSIGADTTITVELEPIPEELPTVQTVTLYMDAAFTEAAAEQVTVNSETKFYGKATYGDGVEYPAYYIGGVWEYSVDGINWTQDTEWGRNRFDYWPGWSYRDDADVSDLLLTGSYDLRLRVTSKDLYTTGEAVLSNVIHINGGASSSGSGSGDPDSGGSGSGSTEETTGYKLTLNYDADQCSVKVTDKSNDAEVTDGGYVTIGTYGALMEICVYVSDGYRIENVQFIDSKGTQDLTEHYIVGTYGMDPMLYAYSDCTLTITTGAIPSDLPTVTGVVLYSDAARTEAMDDDVTLEDGEYDVVYARATYADGGSYPNYTARGTLEYTLDGQTWKKGVYGNGQIDFTLNSYADEYYNTGVKYPQYDYRIRFDPDNMYCTGESVYSEVYHVNGGTSSAACEHANTVTIGQKAATCGEAGYTGDIYCNDCQKTITYGTTISATGEHSWNDGEITTQPTVDSEGVKTFTCTVCNATQTETVAKLKMQEVSWTVNSVTWTYGKIGQVNNDAYNDTEDGGALSYSSSAPAVATVNENGRVTIVGAGTATITATAAAVENKYAETSASYTLTVNKAPLTVTAEDRSISYGEAPANGGYAVDGLVNDEDESVLIGIPAYTYTYEQYGATGTYAISLTGLSAKNYDITFVPGTLTVEKATTYTITPGKLEQVADHTSAVTVSIAPYDSTAMFKVEYEVNGAWTQTVPADAGTYAVRISLTASDNIVLDGALTECTLIVDHSVTVDGADADASVSVEDGKAALVMEAPAEVAASANGDVTIDLGGISDIEELELPAALISGLSENENAGSLTVTTEDVGMTLSGEVLDTVTDVIESNEDTVTVRLTAVEPTDLNEEQQAALDSIAQDAVIVEVALVITHADGSETELHELGGSVEITVPYDSPVPEGKYIVVSYVSDDGSVSYVRAAYDKDTKQVTFKTDHFSIYALFLSSRNAYDVTVTDGSGSGTYLEGSTVIIQADSRSGYTFTKWEVVSGVLALTDGNADRMTFTMPAEDVVLKAVYTRNSSGGGSSSGGSSDSGKPAAPVAPFTPFTDVPAGCYYESAVLWAVKKDITTGVTETSFVPDGACARAQLVTFLWRAAGRPAADYAMSFSDVQEDNWYTEAVRWAASLGIVRGYDNGGFGTDDDITREQVVTILYRYASAMGMDVSIGGDTNILSFHDALTVSEYAVGAMQWAVGAGIVQGADGSLVPNGSCTRAQIVTMLYRLLETED